MNNRESVIQDRLNQLPVQISVRICGCSLKLDQFLNWTPGTMLSFDQSASSPLTLQIGPRIVGEGQAVKIGSKIGLRIQRIGEKLPARR